MMKKRKIITINEEKCNGCGLCVPSCPEGALQIVDGKARLVRELYCDGLGACLGRCPQGAITIEERDAEDYNERKVMENIVKQGKDAVRDHLHHLQEHGQLDELRDAVAFLREQGIELPAGKKTGMSKPPMPAHAFSGCPGSRMMAFDRKDHPAAGQPSQTKSASQLRQWPIQIMLVPARAPFFNEADLLIAADCVPFAYADFHSDLLKDKVLLVGCPKLDDAQYYGEKFEEIFKLNSIQSVSYAHMEVPCCFGLIQTIQSAIAASGKNIPFHEITISIRGDKLS
ncbi:MAG: 4Fe-4S binding protein [Candidatus Omnitrophica bacterium]|nr:4Fe-4S binding protein [Candidatus Omnitrophota bacterium]